MNERKIGLDLSSDVTLMHISTTSFHRAKECILLGGQADQDNIPEIRRQLDLRN